MTEMEASGGGPELMKMSEVRKVTGVDVETLRMLVSDGLLPGVVRGRAGHVYLRADSIPTYQHVLGLVRSQRGRHLEAARRDMLRVQVEMEAVSNDITMALEEPRAPLGHDLSSLNVRSYREDGSTLASALARLERTSWEIRAYHGALLKLMDVTAEQVD